MIRRSLPFLTVERCLVDGGIDSPAYNVGASALLRISAYLYVMNEAILGALQCNLTARGHSILLHPCTVCQARVFLDWSTRFNLYAEGSSLTACPATLGTKLAATHGQGLMLVLLIH